jgi:hypothetical protein
MHYKVGFIFSGNREEKEDWISTPNKLDSESNSGHLSYPQHARSLTIVFSSSVFSHTGIQFRKWDILETFLA